MATVAETTVLDPACPDKWLDGRFEPLFELSWRDYGDVQLQVLKRLFDQFNGPVQALE